MTNNEEKQKENQELFRGVGVIVDIKNKDNFLKIAETLTRIGVSSKSSKKLFQSCHILHKSNNGESVYAIVHFKEMFKLDGKPSSIDEQDIIRRNTIVKLLSEWGLVTVKDDRHDLKNTSMSLIKVLAHSQKHHWELVEKYKISGRSNNE